MFMWMTFQWEVDWCEWNGGNPLNSIQYLGLVMVFIKYY